MRYELINNTIGYYPDNYTKNPIKVGSYKDNTMLLEYDHFRVINHFEIPIDITEGFQVHIYDKSNEKVHFLPQSLLDNYKKRTMYIVPIIYMDKDNIITRINNNIEQLGLF